jgi:dephospho-CoA kinase
VRRPIAVALTGGIGAGKSEALKAFARRGVPTLSADEVVHRVYAEDAEVRAALRDRYGEAVLETDGGVDRAAVAERVFAEPAELQWLEGLVHPRVGAVTERWRRGLLGAAEPPPVYVVEVPLLYEAGRDASFDVVVAITAPDEIRHARTRKVRQADRERRLLPDGEKLRRADFGYVNDGTLDELDAFVGHVLDALGP